MRIALEPRVGLALRVFLFSLLLRATWAAFAHVTPISDFHGYNALALNWLESGTFGSPARLAYRTPGYPGFLALVYLCFGHSWKAVAMVQAFLGAVTSGLVVLLAAHVLSPRGSLIAGLLHAVSPPAVVYVPILASENLAVPLVVSGLLCLAIADRCTGPRRYAAIAGSGAAIGVLVLVRPAAALVLPAALFLAAYSPQKRAWRLGPPLVFFCVTVLVVAPWLVRNHLGGLGPVKLSTAGGINAWMGNNDAATGGGYCKRALSARGLRHLNLSERERDAAYRAAALAWIRAHPRRYLALFRTRALRLLGAEPDVWAARYLVPTRENDMAMKAGYRRWKGRQSLSPSLLSRARAVQSRNITFLAGIRAISAPLILLALALSLVRWRSYAIFVLPALCYLGGLSLVYAQPRFRALADPLLFVPLAGLLSDLLFGTEELGSRPSRFAKTAVAVLLVAASVLLHAAGPAITWYRLTPSP